MLGLTGECSLGRPNSATDSKSYHGLRNACLIGRGGSADPKTVTIKQLPINPSLAKCPLYIEHKLPSAKWRPITVDKQRARCVATCTQVVKDSCDWADFCLCGTQCDRGALPELVCF